MTSRWLKYNKIVSILVSLVVILLLSISFGQVIGNYYLKNMSKDPREQRKQSSVSRENINKTRVLRLNKFTYYTILVSEQDNRDTALVLGQSLAEKRLPVVITGSPPYRVLLGFLNNRENLSSLAESIRIDGKKTVVIPGEINTISYKFSSRDIFAEQNIAPYIGRLSQTLEKALVLYSGITVNEDNINKNRSKFAALAGEIEKLAAQGNKLGQEGQNSNIDSLSAPLLNWAKSLRDLERDWQDTQFLISQQQALLLLQEFEKFLQKTN